MPEAQLIIRLLLGFTFLLSAGAKLLDLNGTRRAIIEFGLPEAFADPGSFALPLAEIVAASLLIFGATAWWGAIASLMLLGLFTGAITVNLLQGRKPDCHCFGQLHSEPVGWRTIARNLVLAVAALFVLAQGTTNRDSTAFHTLGQLSVATWISAVGAVAILAVVVIVLGLLRRILDQNQQLLVRLKMLESQVRDIGTTGVVAKSTEEASVVEPGLPVGANAPDFNLPDLDGRLVSLESLSSGGRAIFLLFIGPNCDACDSLLPEVAQWQDDYDKHLDVVVVSSGEAETNRAKATKHGLRRILLQTNFEVADAYQVGATPSAVLVHPDGTIASPIAIGPLRTQWLLRRFLELLLPAPIPLASTGAAEQVQVEPTLRVGDPAPSVTLSDHTGREVDLVEFRGKTTLLLFFSTTCSWCRAMLPGLQKWDATAGGKPVQLVVILTGSAEDARDLNLQSPVLIESTFVTAYQFDLNGTPMAAVLDESGRLVTRIGGSDAILEFLASPSAAFAPAIDQPA